jgi:collagen type III alpha
MTSEGQYAGRQPAEATSGGAEPPDDVFPPDADGPRTPGRASVPPPAGHTPPPADDFPTSYAPPPHATPNGGSPFVVPAVPPFGQSPDVPFGPSFPAADRYGSPAAEPSAGFPPAPPSNGAAHARPAGPAGGFPQADAGSFPQADAGRAGASAFPVQTGPAQPGGASAAGSARVPQGSARVPQADHGPLPRRGGPGGPLPGSGDPRADSAFPGGAFAGGQHPRPGGGFAGQEPASGGRDTGGSPSSREPLPRRSSATDLFGGARAAASDAAQAPQSAWAPPAAANVAPEDDPFEPHPYRSGTASGSSPSDFDGFAPGSPTRGRTGRDHEAVDPQPSAPVAPSRASGTSPFDSSASPSAAGGPFGPPASPSDAGSAASRPSAPSGESGPVHEARFAPGLGDSRPAAPDARVREQASSGRPPGISAFGDQRIRVPGATLTGLPDAPSPVRGGSPDVESPVPSASSPSPSASASSVGGGLPRRAPADNVGDADSGRRLPAGDLPVRSNRSPLAQEPSFGDGGSFASGDPQGRAEVPTAFNDSPATPPSSSAHEHAGRVPADSDDEFPFGRGTSSDSPARPALTSPDSPAQPPYGGNPSVPVFGRASASGSGASSSFPRPVSTDSGGSPFAGQSGGSGSASGGFAQRAPGASLAATGAPAATEPRGGAVPQPRDPADPAALAAAPATSAADLTAPGGPAGFGAPAVPGGPAAPEAPAASGPAGPAGPATSAAAPAKGTARPVSASASVPTASRVAPADGDELTPAPAVAPQARVYGRPIRSDDGQPPAPVPSFARPPGAPGNAAPFGRPEGGRHDDDQPGESRREPGRPDSGAAGGRMPHHSGSHPADQLGGPSQDMPPLGPKTLPPGGNRGTARATASARVAPPPPPSGPAQDDRSGPPYNEFTTDVARRGRGNSSARPAPADNYGENTTDMAGRGSGSDRPYVPAPALPSLHARPPLVDGFPPPDSADPTRQSGVSPDRRLSSSSPGQASPSGAGPANRATVTPPGPDQTASWPGPAEEGTQAGQGRFDAFKPDTATAAKPETPHVRMLPTLIGVILVAALVVGAAMGLVWLISRGSDSGFSANAGDCVKRSGENAVKAHCGDSGTFVIVSNVDTKEQCPDPGQPYVLNPTDGGKTQVLCLKPSR